MIDSHNSSCRKYIRRFKGQILYSQTISYLSECTEQLNEASKTIAKGKNIQL